MKGNDKEEEITQRERNGENGNKRKRQSIGMRNRLCKDEKKWVYKGNWKSVKKYIGDK